MFEINKNKLLNEEKIMGVAKVTYYLGYCLTCENSPDREIRAACPLADFFPIKTHLSKVSEVKIKKHICANWKLANEIVMAFKKNQSPEVHRVISQNQNNNNKNNKNQQQNR